MSNKKTDKTRTHPPNSEDGTPNPNKSDRYIAKAKKEIAQVERDWT